MEKRDKLVMKGKFSWYVMKLGGEPSKTFVIGG